MKESKDLFLGAMVNKLQEINDRIQEIHSLFSKYEGDNKSELKENLAILESKKNILEERIRELADESPVESVDVQSEVESMANDLHRDAEITYSHIIG